jgi:hypothetical protein
MQHHDHAVILVVCSVIVVLLEGFVQHTALQRTSLGLNL